MQHGKVHGLRTPGEEITFTARLKIHSHSQIFMYGRSIFCLPHWHKFSDFFDLCLHWVSVVRVTYHAVSNNSLETTYILFELPYYYLSRKTLVLLPGDQRPEPRLKRIERGSFACCLCAHCDHFYQISSKNCYAWFPFWTHGTWSVGKKQSKVNTISGWHLNYLV